MSIILSFAVEIALICALASAITTWLAFMSEYRRRRGVVLGSGESSAQPMGDSSSNTGVATPRSSTHPRSVNRWFSLMASDAAMRVRLWFLRRAFGMDIGKDVHISPGVRLDFTNPRGVHIGNGTYVEYGSTILAHDSARQLNIDTWVGENCLISSHSIIMPGVRVGDQCIVSAAAVVMKDVPSRSFVAGNPARILQKGISTVKWGVLVRDPRPQELGRSDYDRLTAPEGRR
jgi:acetyltransferase-like isoleucine patch superfamily enzyme